MSSLQWDHGKRKVLWAGGTFLGVEVHYLRGSIRSIDFGESNPLRKIPDLGKRWKRERKKSKAGEPP